MQKRWSPVRFYLLVSEMASGTLKFAPWPFWGKSRGRPANRVYLEKWLLKSLACQCEPRSSCRKVNHTVTSILVWRFVFSLLLKKCEKYTLKVHSPAFRTRRASVLSDTVMLDTYKLTPLAKSETNLSCLPECRNNRKHGQTRKNLS